MMDGEFPLAWEVRMISKSKPDVSFSLVSSWLHHNLSETLRALAPLGEGEFNAVLKCDFLSGRTAVLKVAPKQNGAVMTYEQGMMASELDWYDTICKKTKILTPKIVSRSIGEKGDEFNYFLMEYIGGKPLDHPDWTKEDEQSIKRQKVDAMASMHQIRGNGFGYVQRALKANWYEAIEQMISDLLSDALRKGKVSKRGERLLKIVRDAKPILEQVECRMVNFDLWNSNWIATRTNNGVELVLIDPERCFYGDFLGDFVAFEFLKPLSKKRETLDLYAKVGGVPFELDGPVQIRYAILTGYLALIMEIEKYYRYKPGMAGWTRNVLVSRLLYHQAFTMIQSQT
jgi:hypothetical protein